MKCLLRNNILLGLVACLMLASLVGCGNNSNRDIILYGPSESDGEDKVSVTFFGFKADALNQTAIESALQGFMAENDNINITYDSLKGAAYWNAFDKRDAADVLDDMFMINHDHVVDMGSQGKLADLSDIDGLEGYTDMARGQFTNADGTVYFLPTCISTYNLYINYDFLEAHGQSVPENWEDFQKCCDYFLDEGIVPIIANNTSSLPTMILGKSLFDIYQQPKEELEATIRKFNEYPELFAEALSPGVEQVAEMIDRGWFDPEEVLATAQTSDDLELFLKGDRPFMLSGGWASIRLINREPDFTYGVHPYPILEDGGVLILQVDTCISVNADSQSCKAAKKFVEYLIRPDIMWAYCDSQASYTPLKEEKRVPSEKTLLPSNEYLSNGRAVLGADYRLNLPTEDALKSCANVLLSGGTVSEAKQALAEALAE